MPLHYHSSEPFSGVLFAIGGTFLFALKSILIKFAFAAGTDATTLLLLRMLLAAPFYALILLWTLKRSEGQLPQITTSLKILALGFFGYYLASFLDLSGLEHISAQLERLTLFTYPTMVAILAWLFLGEKITRWIIISLLLSYAGIFSMYHSEQLLSADSNIMLGVLLVLGSALSYSIYVIFAKPLIQRFGSQLFTSIAMLGSTIFVIIHYQCTHGLLPTQWQLGHIPLVVWGYAGLLAFFCTVIPSYMITTAIKRIGATRTTILGSAGPVFTILLAVLLIGEPFTRFHLLGVVLVLFGVLLVTYSPNKKVQKSGSAQ